jgi:cell division protein ZapA (FtsZ GTPase activity inhibitor)
MAASNGSPKITIDEKDYDINDLSDEAKGQLASLQAVDRRLSSLKEETAILQTARIAYSNALRDLLPRD